jgi:GNAT superfamily N-acetyltransferase
MIRLLKPADAPICDAIVAGLPDWFEDELGLELCAEAIRSDHGLVAVEEGDVVGFLTWTQPDATAVEINWMAVRSDRRRRGYGRTLIEELARRSKAEGATSILVKTLSGRRPDQGYAQTRAFYAAQGFDPVSELDVWGPENPAVLMKKAL